MRWTVPCFCPLQRRKLCAEDPCALDVNGETVEDQCITVGLTHF